MDSFSIGISGLDAAQKAIDVIGNNVANAATPGYHRQRINLDPAYAKQMGSVLLGGGVSFANVTREIDNFVEQEILRQQSSLAQLSREVDSLGTVENAFGELSTEDGGLNAVIDKFFNSLQDLSAHPTEIIWQDQVVTAAETMASQFRTLGEFLTRTESQITLEAENSIEQINSLTSQIAKLNNQIKNIEVTGGQANNLSDQRDQCINELSKLITVETQSREYGVVDVSIGGIPVVSNSSVIELEVGSDENNSMAISVAGASNYNANVQGGRLGGLLSLKNELIPDIHNDLDSLASAIIQQINQYHFQGVGSEGSFTDLTGWSMTSEDLADFTPPVTDGTIYIRVTNTSTGEITRHAISIDASADSLTTIATAITAINAGLTASVASSTLHIQADSNYEFDFLPAVLSGPTASNLTAASPPTVSVSGIYTGSENQTFDCTVIGTGSVGNGNLQLEVKNGLGEVVTTLDIGAGYVTGDKLDIGSGIKVSLSTGDLNAGDTFAVDAFANTDTSGVLAAVGMNTFFSGSGASDMAVCSDISDTPGRIATALGAEMTDNTNAQRMSGLREQALSGLDTMTPGEFYRRLVTNIGQQLSVKQMREDNIQTMVQNLTNQQSDISGVNINDEAAKLLVFEQMFQAMAKYLSTVRSSLSSIMEII